MRFAREGDFVRDATTGNLWSVSESAWVEHAIAEHICRKASMRLPTIEELFVLVDRTRVKPAIDATFSLCQSNWYWSSTRYAGHRDSWWGIDFSTGKVAWSQDGGSGYVRGVKL
jgi:hypothetical protein